MATTIRNSPMILALVGLLTSTVLGFGGWVFAGVSGHETRLAVEEQRSLENDKYHTESLKRLERIERKLDDLLEGAHARNSRPTR